jgi:hypothetical protein
MPATLDNISIADILGPWINPDWDSGLIARLREAWNKPLRDLSNEDLATLLRQRFAVEQILPIARQRLADGIDDDMEIFDEELQEAIEDAIKSL